MPKTNDHSQLHHVRTRKISTTNNRINSNKGVKETVSQAFHQGKKKKNSLKTYNFSQSETKSFRECYLNTEGRKNLLTFVGSQIGYEIIC